MQEQDIWRLALEVVRQHAERAQMSEYDRSVAITAISRARNTIEDLAKSGIQPNKCKQAILDALEKLRANYHDPDGEFTNGKGVIGSLRDDIATALSR